MCLGRLVEVAGSDDLYEDPLHAYAQALLSAVPVPDPQIEGRRKRLPVTGDIPSAFSPRSGCHFRTRCPYAQQRCSEEEPPLIEARSGHTVACHFWEQISAARSAVSVKEVS